MEHIHKNNSETHKSSPEESYEHKRIEQHESHKLSSKELEKAENDHLSEIERAKERVARIEAKSSQELLPVQNKEKPLSGASYISHKKKLYTETLKTIRKTLKPQEKILSNIVHSKSLEKPLEIVSKTIFRPTPVLFAGITAFMVTAMIFILAKTGGYSIRGSGWLIVSLLAGYFIGVLIDFLRLLFMNKKY